MSKTINDYTAAITIDGANDYLLLEQGGVYKKINRNVLTGLSSAPLGLTDSQSPQNKTYDNTNQVTLKGTKFTLQDDTDATKQAQFLMSSITTGTTRSYTLPDASATIVGTTATQTLTNKTLTSPTINGGTIDNATITVDSISGHSVSTTVTVANLQIANGVLNSSNAVTSTSVAAGAIQPQALVSGTGTGWAWSSWTPTWTNFTPGNATVDYKYIQIGKTVFFRVQVTLGTTSVMGSNPRLTLPVTSISYQNTTFQVASGIFAGSYLGYVNWSSTTTADLKYFDTNTNPASVTATAPLTWGNTNTFNFSGFYEAA